MTYLATALALILLPLPEDVLHDPEKWNSDWDALLRRELAIPIGPALCLNQKLREFERIPTRNGVDDALDCYQSVMGNTRAIQHHRGTASLHP